MEPDLDVVDSGVGVVDDIAEIDGERLRVFEEGGVAGDVLLHGPIDAIFGGLGGAGAEELGAAQPEAENAVELAAFAVCFPLEDDFGELLGRAAGGGIVRGCYRGLG